MYVLSVAVWGLQWVKQLGERSQGTTWPKIYINHPFTENLPTPDIKNGGWPSMVRRQNSRITGMKPDRSTQQIPGHSGLQGKTLSQKARTNSFLTDYVFELLEVFGSDFNKCWFFFETLITCFLLGWLVRSFHIYLSI